MPTEMLGMPLRELMLVFAACLSLIAAITGELVAARNRELQRESADRVEKLEAALNGLRVDYDRVVGERRDFADQAERLRFLLEQSGEQLEMLRGAFLAATAALNHVGFEMQMLDDGRVSVTHIATNEERATFRAQMH